MPFRTLRHSHQFDPSVLGGVLFYNFIGTVR